MVNLKAGQGKYKIYMDILRCPLSKDVLKEWGKWKESEVVPSCPTLRDPWAVAYQAPPSKEFSRPEYWSGLQFPSPLDLPNPGIKPRSPKSQADTLPSEPPGKPSKSERDMLKRRAWMALPVPKSGTNNWITVCSLIQGFTASLCRRWLQPRN